MNFIYSFQIEHFIYMEIFLAIRHEVVTGIFSGELSSWSSERCPATNHVFTSVGSALHSGTCSFIGGQS